MRYYVGLDLSLDSTHICVLDEGGAVVNRAITPTDPASIADHLMGLGRRVSRVGFEMTATAAWIYEGLSQRGLPAICIEARHAHGILKNNINKTDRNDARGIAELMRIGVFRNVHIKTREAQEFRTLLTTRKLLQIKVIDLENGIGGILRAFGLKVRRVRQDAFQAQVETLAAGSPMLLEMVGHLLAARATLRAHFDGNLVVRTTNPTPPHDRPRHRPNRRPNLPRRDRRSLPLQALPHRRRPRGADVPRRPVGQAPRERPDLQVGRQGPQGRPLQRRIHNLNAANRPQPPPRLGPEPRGDARPQTRHCRRRPETGSNSPSDVA